MATASSVLSEDQFLCSICLDVFTEPVSVPCGHNFCKACISRHWKDKVHCQCPLCKETFNKELKLCVNTGFREVVENFKQHHVTAKNDSPVKEGEVPCDICLGIKFKACKTCLVCLTSYCETHLEPHERVAALVRHELTDPVQNLEDKICKKHNRILELNCRDDLTPVCVLCSEHRAYNTVLLEEEYEENKVQIEKEKSEIQVIKLKRHKKARKRKVEGQTKVKDKAVANSVVSNQLQAPKEGPHSIQLNRYSYDPAVRNPFEGRFYMEVQTEWKTGWHLGEVRCSMCEKKTFKHNFRNRNSNISLRNNTNCRALHNIITVIPVFVGYEKGLVYIYNADTENVIVTFISHEVNDRVNLFFSPGITEYCINCITLVPSQKRQKKAKSIKDILALNSDNLRALIILVFFFVVAIAFTIVICIVNMV
ncbi:E3 ubiquitin/ISG15 ligase TRIM25-like [Scomber scombrus]|uniref:E3 ubiquitin/ISG15 ligase TRIM25-like n=1 Tax=Scomber scombrus TaxID=13677 RepID=UPI002DD80D01|nr:E3 ubiquitin/ISG15 ligase TRIM25-like [Scomber scombrus]